MEQNLNMEELVRFIAQKLVDEPDAVSLTSSLDEDGTNRLTLAVAPRDIGKVIGRQGRIAKAIRTVLRAAAKDGARYILDIDSEKIESEENE